MPERPSWSPAPLSPDGVCSFRQQLTVSEDAVDVAKSGPADTHTIAQGLRTIPSVEDFIARYPGTIVSAEAHENPGFPVWVGVQHFFNVFLMIFLKDGAGRRPVYGGTKTFQEDQHWRDFQLFGMLDAEQLLAAGKSGAFSRGTPA